jgi:hypothetical protein
MKIDTEHLHYWMQAIRKSNDPMRTMDAFWSGQIKSKEWLILTLENLIPTIVNIDIYGGWVGVLASMLFQSKLTVNTIRSIDVDPQCEPIANIMNNIELNKGKFKAITANMINVTSTANVVINTSCEHISQNEYNDWLKKISDDSLLVLQSNNYKISEHIRVANTVEEFVDQSNLKKVLFKEGLSLPLYNRYMIIGYK